MLYTFEDLNAMFDPSLLVEAGRLLDSGEVVSPDVSRTCCRSSDFYLVSLHFFSGPVALRKRL